MQKKYERASHTADVRLRVWGKNYKELFENAARGLSSIVFSKAEKLLEKGRYDAKEEIEAQSANISTLLIDFLSEILSKIQINKMIYIAKIMEITEVMVRAKIYGKKVDYFNEDVKAVTYHAIIIRKTPKGILASTIVLDI